jgi:polar amino acid transport system substrate-binding protein
MRYGTCGWLIMAAWLATCGAGIAQFADAPSLWDPNRHPARPDLAGFRAIRFLTEDDYPPLNFRKPDGDLAGFNVEVARAICEQLVVGCTIQARRFDTLVDSLLGGKGDAVIASIAASPAMRESVEFSAPYYRTPGRFVGRADRPALDPSADGLEGKKVAVIGRSAHETYVRLFFPKAKIETVPNFAGLISEVKDGSVDLAFADGLTLSVWLAGDDSANCCAFRGGPYLDGKFFGEGVSVAVRKEDATLRVAIDWALARMAQNGVYAELLRKYFPVGFQ